MERQNSHYLLSATLVAFCAFCILIALGLWQLNRKVWKEGIIAQITQQAKTEPLLLPPECHWTSWEKKIGSYRYVKVSGKLLTNQELRFHTPSPVDSSAGNSPGFFVLTPLVQNDGSIVILNRGFMPIHAPYALSSSAEQEEKTFIGFIRPPEKRGWLMPENNPEKNQWFVQDPQMIAETYGFKRVAPFLIDIVRLPEEPLRLNTPMGRNRIPAIPNDHLGYALTWFGLAGALLAVYTLWILQRHEENNNSSKQLISS
jgi:surfeit locus 1 family protein